MSVQQWLAEETSALLPQEISSDSSHTLVKQIFPASERVPPLLEHQLQL